VIAAAILRQLHAVVTTGISELVLSPGASRYRAEQERGPA